MEVTVVQARADFSDAAYSRKNRHLPSVQQTISFIQSLVNKPIFAYPQVDWETHENVIPVRNKIDVFRLLAGTPRAGFVEHSIKAPENILGHTTDLVRLARHFAPLFGLDPNHCAALAMVHDLAEAIAPDIT